VIKLRLSLPCPVNRRFTPISYSKKFPSGKRVTLARQVLSKEYRQKQERLVSEVWKQLGGRPTPYVGAVQINFTITPATKKTPDQDAYHKALYDGLARAGVVSDDVQLVSGNVERMPNAQYPGHLEVEIYPLEPQP
jgi:Holliday junction resolvase RusA-like endonuclease